LAASDQRPMNRRELILTAAALSALLLALRERRRRRTPLDLDAQPLDLKAESLELGLPLAPPPLKSSTHSWAKLRARRRLLLLANLRDMAGTLGLDIGGTLAKMALAVSGKSEHGVFHGAGFVAHPHLTFCVELEPAGATCLTLQFVSTGTSMLTESVGLLQSRLPQLSPASRPQRSRLGTWGAPDRDAKHSTARKIVTAGGGAHKYGELFEDALGLRLVPFKELAALVEGA